ncbi:Hypothetical predicted protein [Mytilus galloprovincialis]|uniref:SCP domain-containing protein n=1 Tax=Mytilus galloprovincialis TaxID=29158 RepID=A0A8B6ELA3_MYTGA|nr:Hypothetical predicted protein [Mytilus galloprovincialis]
MSMTSTKWSSESNSVDGIWTTTVKVAETFENPDGRTQTKTRTIELDGKPTKTEINAMVESTQEPQHSDYTKHTADEFKREAVREHNTLRQTHGVPPLSLAQDLCVLAQKWADYLIDNNKQGHSSNELGENLAEKSGHSPTLDYAGCYNMLIDKANTLYG